MMKRVCKLFFLVIKSSRKYGVSEGGIQFICISVCTGYKNMIMMIFDLHWIWAGLLMMMMMVVVEDNYKWMQIKREKILENHNHDHQRYPFWVGFVRLWLDMFWRLNFTPGIHTVLKYHSSLYAMHLIFWSVCK